ncbi:hypothetical protein D1871_11770 [Nakamurella silvestris]|nr:hypothetical protein D1871_11770 [Nakamurella silvestris]
MAGEPPPDLFEIVAPDPADPAAPAANRPVEPQRDLEEDRTLTAAEDAAARRPVGRRGRGIALALAAGTLVVGLIGGYALAGGGHTVTDGQAAAPSMLLGLKAPSSSPTGQMSDLPGIAFDPGYGGYPMYGGMGAGEHRHFLAGPELPSIVGTAPAWVFDQASVLTRSGIARVAKVLGVTGEPTEELGTWTVGYQNNLDATLQVSTDGMAGMLYENPSLDSAACRSTTPGPDLCSPKADPAESEKASFGLISDVLAELGVEVADLSFRQLSDVGDTNRTFVVEQLIDGHSTGTPWMVMTDGSEIRSLTGPLAPLVGLGTFPVVSAAEATERMNDPRYLSGAWQYETIEGVAEYGPETESVQVPVVPAPGSTIDWPVRSVTILSADLVYAQQFQGDGSTVLLPSYRLYDQQKSSWVVMAVADEALDFG